MTTLETLPDEIFLIIFRYLHKMDLLYAFSKLNSRFEQLITPCFYEMNFTSQNPTLCYPYKPYLRFIDYVFSQHGRKICLLKLGSELQSKLLHRRITQFINLESVELIKSYENNDSDEFLKILLSIPSLSHLKLTIKNDDMLKTIVTQATSNLTTLHFVDLPEFQIADSCRKLIHVKRLFVSLRDYCNRNLPMLFTLIPNLTEANLAIKQFRFNSSFSAIHLKKLHIEKRNFFPTDYDELQEFLSNFIQAPLVKFTLILFDATRDFGDFDKLTALVRHFPYLESFHYYIEKSDEPDTRFLPHVEHVEGKYNRYAFFTEPKSQPFDYVRKNRHLSAYLQFTQLRDINDFRTCKSLEIDYDSLRFRLTHLFKIVKDLTILENLTKLSLNCMFRWQGKDHYLYPLVDTDEYSFLRWVLRISPKLNTLSVCTDCTKDIIQELRKLTSSQTSSRIIHFHAEDIAKYSCTYHSTFFKELAELYPSLKTLSFICNDEYRKKFPETLLEFIVTMRNLFPKLVCMTLGIIYQMDLDRYMKTLDQSGLVGESLSYEVIMSYPHRRRTKIVGLNIWV
ncbi:unnamed protein product [Adineta ricciae]|uniref:F-box domain-containing protein n=1 Tax=Adineta ricciae TaxID=249248 RepID=A0A816E0U9_ADIRI|nr:unnamed protein product [Adineta ricciae]CAF1640724.1 unnamed protein product [Adineta ricciae]